MKKVEHLSKDDLVDIVEHVQDTLYGRFLHHHDGRTKRLVHVADKPPDLSMIEAIDAQMELHGLVPESLSCDFEEDDLS